MECLISACLYFFLLPSLLYIPLIIQQYILYSCFPVLWCGNQEAVEMSTNPSLHSQVLGLETVNSSNPFNDTATKRPELQELANAGDDDASVSSETNDCFLVRWAGYVVPYGGMLSGIFNLASFTLGAGIISIPSAFHTSGILMALFYLVVVTGLTIYAIRLLAVASERTGLRTFEELARGLFGRGGDILCATLMILLCFGAAIGYLIALGDIVETLLNHDTTSAFFRTENGKRVVVSIIFLFCIFPLVFPKEINSLRYVSAIGVSFIIFFVFCVMGHSAAAIHRNGVPEGLVLAGSGNAGVSGLGLFIYAYMCQVPSLNVFYEMRPKRSVNRMTLQALISCATCGVMYFICGLFGYLEFGVNIKGSVLKEFDPYQDIVFFICYIGLIVKLCAAFSLNMLGCRTAFFATFNMDVPSMPYWKHSIVAASFAIPALLISLFFTDIKIMFGLAGAICGGFIGFIFPALFVMYAGNWTRERVGWISYLSTYFVLFAGVVAVIFGAGDTILSIVIKYG